MLKYLTLSLCIAGCLGLYGQEFNIGVKLQKAHFMYWENGIAAQYSFANFKPQQFYLGIDYYSSRLGTAWNSNAIKQDNYVLSAAWYFRKAKTLRITSKLNLGFLKANLHEEFFDELPNTAVLLSPEFGLQYDFTDRPFAVNLSSGYNINLKEEGESPGTFVPLYYSFTLFYQFQYKKIENEK